MARLDKAALVEKAQRKDNLSIFKAECRKRPGRLARLAGRFVLCSLLAISPVIAGQHAPSQTKQEPKTTEAAAYAFPTIESISSFNEPGKKKEYGAEAARVMGNISAFVQKNGNNKAFKLIAEAVMDEALNIQTEKGIYYYIDAYDSAVTVTDSPKSWKKRITMRQVPQGVEVSVETEGEPRLSLTLREGSLPSMDSVIGLRYRLSLLFEDIIGTAPILRAAGSD